MTNVGTTMIRRVAALFLLISTLAPFVHAQLREPLSVKSPRGPVEIRLLAGEPRLRFTVIMNGTTVIEPSPMSFTLDGVDLTDGATPGRRENYGVNEEYPTLGVHARAVNYCEGVRQAFKHAASGQEFTIDLRAYADGVAFRFIVPGGSDKPRVPDEGTTFTLPAGAAVWSHNLRGHYEGTYERREAAALESGTWHAPPVTFKLSGGTYGAITEANLVNYSGMALEADGNRGLKVGLAHRQPVSYPYELRYTKEDVARLSQPATVTGTITTPWRVVMLAADLNQLVNSDLVTNLNPPPDPKLFPPGTGSAWVMPGRAVWRYLDEDASTKLDPGADPPDARGGAATRPTGRPSSAGARTELQMLPAGAVTIDAPGGGGSAVVQLAQGSAAAEAVERARAARDVATTSASRPGAATRGATTRSATTTTTTSTGPASRPRVTAKELKIWSELAGKLGFEYSILEGFWSRWTPDELKDLVDSSRVQGVGIWVWVHSRNLRTAEQRAEMFKRCVDAGVVGLKLDYFDHEHKETIDLYQAILKEAARSKLLLNFHGSNKPTGSNRTWPNELVRESVRGMETRSLKERASHHTTLPFTRFIAGPAEYTTVMFSERRGDTTFAHQIATPVVFTAPLQTYAAHPQKLLTSPAADVIRQIPPVWDQTIVLPPSEIGEVAVFARRFEGKWFLAVLNGPEARQLSVPLAFLGSGKFTATLVRDDKTPETMRVEKDVPLSAKDAVTIDLPAGGGFVAVFTKKDE